MRDLQLKLTYKPGCRSRQLRNKHDKQRQRAARSIYAGGRGNTGENNPGQNSDNSTQVKTMRQQKRQENIKQEVKYRNYKGRQYFQSETGNT